MSAPWSQRLQLTLAKTSLSVQNMYGTSTGSPPGATVATTIRLSSESGTIDADVTDVHPLVLGLHRLVVALHLRPGR